MQANIKYTNRFGMQRGISHIEVDKNFEAYYIKEDGTKMKVPGEPELHKELINRGVWEKI